MLCDSSGILVSVSLRVLHVFAEEYKEGLINFELRT